MPKRESPFDVLVSRARQRFDQSPIGASLGTGSLRRRAQLLHARPDLKFRELRGNIDTRLRKLREGQADALVLAEAGLKRLGWAAEITEVFSPEIILPAVGQGALGIEVRSGDQPCRELLAQVDDSATHKSIIAERTLLSTLRGGCLAPIGAWGRMDGDGRLHLTACVLSGDGSRRLFADCFADSAAAAAIGRQVAEKLLADGANELLEEALQKSKHCCRASRICWQCKCWESMVQTGNSVLSKVPRRPVFRRPRLKFAPASCKTLTLAIKFSIEACVFDFG